MQDISTSFCSFVCFISSVSVGSRLRLRRVVVQRMKANHRKGIIQRTLGS